MLEIIMWCIAAWFIFIALALVGMITALIFEVYQNAYHNLKKRIERQHR